MKKCMVILSVILALCIFQFAGTGSVVAADNDTEVILAAADHSADEAAPAEEEGTAVEEENVGEEVNEGDMEEVPAEEGEEGTTDEMHKSE